MIDFNLLNKSLKYYGRDGFQRIEVPWLVTEAVDSITRPQEAKPYVVEAKNKNLIASGEQGFLYLYLKEYLPMGRFQAVTPCFRNDSFDFTHTKYFMKNELIITDNVVEEELMNLVGSAKNFFMNFLGNEVRVEEVGDGHFDIMYKDTELGSYGIRGCDFLRWIYGTGCAEPRTSKIIKLHNGIS